MTPMIDVVFLLLIFFVCTASFQIAEEVLPSSLLAAGATPSDLEIEVEPDLERVIVKLDLQDEQLAWTVNDRAYASLAEVRDVLRAVAAIDAGLPVVLDVDGRVPLGDVIDLYDLSRIAGFDRIQFAASAQE